MSHKGRNGKNDSTSDDGSQNGGNSDDDNDDEVSVKKLTYMKDCHPH